MRFGNGTGGDRVFAAGAGWAGWGEWDQAGGLVWGEVGRGGAVRGAVAFGDGEVGGCSRWWQFGFFFAGWAGDVVDRCLRWRGGEQAAAVGVEGADQRAGAAFGAAGDAADVAADFGNQHAVVACTVHRARFAVLDLPFRSAGAAAELVGAEVHVFDFRVVGAHFAADAVAADGHLVVGPVGFDLGDQRLALRGRYVLVVGQRRLGRSRIGIVPGFIPGAGLGDGGGSGDGKKCAHD